MLKDTRPGEHSYYINVVYWEDRDCGYREVTTPDEWYDYQLSKFVTGEPEIIRIHKPRPSLPAHQQPEYLRKGIPNIQRSVEQATMIPEVTA